MSNDEPKSPRISGFRIRIGEITKYELVPIPDNIPPFEIDTRDVSLDAFIEGTSSVSWAWDVQAVQRPLLPAWTATSEEGHGV